MINRLIVAILLVVSVAVAMTGCNVASNIWTTSDTPLPFSLRKATFVHKTIEVFPLHNSSLSVFIEGDGTPWIDGTAISRDPTPHYLLALKLMQRSTGNRLYLGRPCYFGTDDPACNYHYWTDRRYSREVIDSMSEVINAVVREHNIDDVTLVGHSGGGTIATLLACRIDARVHLVTIAANLDVAAWSARHHYTPLAGSLNPMTDFGNCPLAGAVHFAGDRDSNVPPSIIRAFGERYQQRVVVVKGADHRNWERFWPELLQQLSSEQQLSPEQLH